MSTLPDIFLLASNSQRRLVNGSVREAVLEAYNGICQYCFGASGQTATCVDHIIPLKLKHADVERLSALDLSSISPSFDVLENMTAACAPCNGAKGNRLLPLETISVLLRKSVRLKPAIELILGTAGLLQTRQTLVGLKSTETDAISFLKGCIESDPQLVRDYIEKKLLQRFYRRGLIAAIFFGQFKIYKIISAVEPISSAEIKNVILTVPETLRSLNHFRILGKNPPDAGPFIDQYNLADCLAGNSEQLAIYFAEQLNDENAYKYLIDEIGKTDPKQTTSDEYSLIDGAVLLDLELIKIGRPGANISITTAFSFALGAVGHAHSPNTSECLNILADRAAALSIENYKALFIACGLGDSDLLNKVLKTLPDKELLNRALAYTLLSSETGNLDQIFFALANAGASLDMTAPLSRIALRKIITEPLRNYGTSVQYFTYPRIYDRSRYIPMIKEVLTWCRPEDIQHALEALVSQSSAIEGAANLWFRQDALEFELVTILKDAGANLIKTAKHGFLWSCAFGDNALIDKFLSDANCPGQINQPTLNKGLRYAARNKHKEIAEILLAKGASLQIEKIASTLIAADVASFMSTLQILPKTTLSHNQKFKIR